MNQPSPVPYNRPPNQTLQQCRRVAWGSDSNSHIPCKIIIGFPTVMPYTLFAQRRLVLGINSHALRLWHQPTARPTAPFASCSPAATFAVSLQTTKQHGMKQNNGFRTGLVRQIDIRPCLPFLYSRFAKMSIRTPLDLFTQGIRTKLRKTGSSPEQRTLLGGKVLRKRHHRPQDRGSRFKDFVDNG